MTGSRGIKKIANTTLAEALRCGPWDCVCMIGGQFSWEPLAQSEEVGVILREQERTGRLIAAICTSEIFYIFTLERL